MGGKQTLSVEQNNNQPYTGSTSTHNSSLQQADTQQRNLKGNGNKTILYGWKKQCLYLIIFLLMILISINLALTLWILKVLEVSKDGMGQMRIVDGGIQLDGQAIILDELKTSLIKSRHGQPLTFESTKNLTFNTRDEDGHVRNQIFLGHDKFEVQSKNFKVSDQHGNTLFYADRDLVEIAADTLRVEGDGGVIFKESIQTPILKAEPGKDLKLESPTRSLELQASQEIFIQSRAGSIEISSLNDIKLRGRNIRFDAENIIISNMKTAQPHNSHERLDHSSSHQMYQVCVCDNGKLFLADTHKSCSSDDLTVCR
ncbi:hypothetical protein PVAND_005538 [Polypedilum vanderplanki]|uniref:Sarcoglycan complex subunit protein n=1 Tax=Polypedilum vanderplanki TaxID=319348 RepID=A0A9J6C1G8_POLVA|nr:hypothetical protein PVAND_005538 [Polypedilum vanderplanki]